MRSHLSVLFPLLLVKSWVIQRPCFFSGISIVSFVALISQHVFMCIHLPTIISAFLTQYFFLPLLSLFLFSRPQHVYHQFSSHIVDLALRRPDSWFSPLHIYILACLPKIHEEHTVYSALGTIYIHYILLLHPCIQIPQLHSWSTCNFTDFVNIGLAPPQNF
jgi:hypothetical protein